MASSAKLTKANMAFRDFYALGTERSLRALQQTYQERAAHGQYVPTTSIDTINFWSRQFGWFDQVREIEQSAMDQFQARQAQEKAQHMATAREQVTAGAIILKRLIEIATEKGLGDLDLKRKTTRKTTREKDETGREAVLTAEVETPSLLEYTGMALRAITEGLRNLNALQGGATADSVQVNVYNDLRDVRQMSDEQLRLERDRLLRELDVDLVPRNGGRLE